jgi:hypothetical protein
MKRYVNELLNETRDNGYSVCLALECPGTKDVVVGTTAAPNFLANLTAKIVGTVVESMAERITKNHKDTI